ARREQQTPEGALSRGEGRAVGGEGFLGYAERLAQGRLDAFEISAAIELRTGQPGQRGCDVRVLWREAVGVDVESVAQIALGLGDLAQIEPQQAEIHEIMTDVCVLRAARLTISLQHDAENPPGALQVALAMQEASVIGHCIERLRMAL